MSEIIMWILNTQWVAIKVWVAFCVVGGLLVGFGFSFVFPFYLAYKIIDLYRWCKIKY